MKKCIKCNNEMFESEKVCMCCGTVQENQNNTQKTVLWIGIILIAVVLYTAYNYKMEEKNNTSSYKEESNEQLDDNNSSIIQDEEDNIIEEDEAYNTAYDTSNFFHISIDDLNKTFNQNDNQKYFVLTASPYCSHCIDFVPKVNKSLEEYEYAVEYIDMSKVSTEEINAIRQRRGFSSFGSTPVVYVVQNGIAIDSSIGNVDYYNYLVFLEKHGVEKNISSDEINIEGVN